MNDNSTIYDRIYGTIKMIYIRVVVLKSYPRSINVITMRGGIGDCKNNRSLSL